MIIERTIEAVLILAAIRAGIRLLARKRAVTSEELNLEKELRGLATAKRLPIATLVLLVLLTIGALAEVIWPGTLNVLRNDPSNPDWWRPLTAPFVQDDGVIGAIFNLVTAAAVMALAEWYWGGLLALGIWAIGAWAPIGAVAALAGYRVAAANTDAYTAGSSGATYFTAATLCAALLCAGTGRDRLIGLVGPVIGLASWLGLGDGHGLLFTAGVIVGVALWVIVRLTGRLSRGSGAGKVNPRAPTSSTGGGSDRERSSGQ